MATFFAGFALLDGLVALFAAAWGLTRGGRWRLLACQGVTGVGAGVLVLFFAWWLKPLVVLAWWAIITGALQAIEAVVLRGGWRGRPLIMATAVISLIFGGLILARPPQDLMTHALAPALRRFGSAPRQPARDQRLPSPEPRPGLTQSPASRSLTPQSLAATAPSYDALLERRG